MYAVESEYVVESMYVVEYVRSRKYVAESLYVAESMHVVESIYVLESEYVVESMKQPSWVFSSREYWVGEESMYASRENVRIREGVCWVRTEMALIRRGWVHTTLQSEPTPRVM